MSKWRIFTWIVLTTFIVLVSGAFVDVYYSHNKQLLLSRVTVTQDCSDLNMVDTAKCLNKELKEFYNYNLSNTYLYWNKGKPKIKDWNRIKEEGGVCWHYAEWYVINAKELGFHGERIVVDYDLNDFDHAIALITNNKDEYCLLDQTKLIGCGKTKESTNETE